VIADTSRRLQSVYVPVGDGARLAVDVWLPVERTAVAGSVGTLIRVTRYHRAEAPQEPGLAADTNAAAGNLFLTAPDSRWPWPTPAAPGHRSARGPTHSTRLSASVSRTRCARADGLVPFRDARVAGLDWAATAPAASGPAIASSGVPVLVRAGWLYGGFTAGALARFVTQASSARVPLRATVISCRPGSTPLRVADSNSDARAPVDT
jgi:hypothetical protein